MNNQEPSGGVIVELRRRISVQFNSFLISYDAVVYYVYRTIRRPGIVELDPWTPGIPTVMRYVLTWCLP